jgi:hypothetical protein
MKKHTFHILLLFLTCVSCQREETVDLEIEQKSKLVPAVFIGVGDTTFSAIVGRSTKIIGDMEESNSTQMVTTATGSITNLSSNISYTLTYDEDNFKYFVNAAPETVKAGGQYKVQFWEGDESVEGMTTIVDAVKASVSMKFDSTLDLAGNQVYSALFTCTSGSSGLHYIRLYPMIIYSDSSAMLMSDYANKQDIKGLQEGQSYTHQFSSMFSSPSIFPVRVQVMVIACDEPYARYYNAARAINYNEISPLSEPSFIYSNMSNGAGVIASYNVSEIVSLPVE